MATSTALNVGYGLEGGFIVLGLAILLWWWRRRKVAPKNPLLGPLPVSGPDIALFLCVAIAAFVGGQILGVGISKWLGINELYTAYLAILVVAEPVFLGGVLLFFALHPRFGLPKPTPGSARQAAALGPATFLAAFPIVMLVLVAWQGGLDLIGHQVSNQDTVEVFLHQSTWLRRSLFTVFGVLMAPIAEELVFRVVLFRGLKNFLPRVWAIVVSSVLFGAAHHDLSSFLPLVVFGAILAVVYESTGNIGVTMIAHALFNLNSLVALLLGINH